MAAASGSGSNDRRRRRLPRRYLAAPFAHPSARPPALADRRRRRRRRWRRWRRWRRSCVRARAHTLVVTPLARCNSRPIGHNNDNHHRRHQHSLATTGARAPVAPRRRTRIAHSQATHTRSLAAAAVAAVATAAAAAVAAAAAAAIAALARCLARHRRPSARSQIGDGGALA